MPKYPDDFSDIFESHFGGSTRKERAPPREPEPEVFSEGWCAEQSLVDNWIIFLALAVLEPALLKSGYPKELAEAIRKRIHEIAPYYGPVKKGRKS